MSQYRRTYRRAQERARREQLLADHYRVERDHLRKLVKQLQGKEVPLDDHWRIAAEKTERRIREMRREHRRIDLQKRVVAVWRHLVETWELSRGLEKPERFRGSKR